MGRWVGGSVVSGRWLVGRWSVGQWSLDSIKPIQMLENIQVVRSGDIELENHLKPCGKNASYISKTSQNELIYCCGKFIKNALVKEIKESNSFQFELMKHQIVQIRNNCLLF